MDDRFTSVAHSTTHSAYGSVHRDGIAAASVNGTSHRLHGTRRTYPKGAILFVEADAPKGVFLLTSGRVKLTTTTCDGRSVLLSVAEPGDTLALSAVLSATVYETTAEAIEHVEIEFVPKDVFLAHLRHDPLSACAAAVELSRRYRDAHSVIRSLAHAESVLVKLSRLFLSWTDAQPSVVANETVRIANRYTHQQLAEMIGTSRETVTRVLGEMRVRGLATLKGSDLLIHRIRELASVAGDTSQCDIAHRRAAG